MQAYTGADIAAHALCASPSAHAGVRTPPGATYSPTSAGATALIHGQLSPQAGWPNICLPALSPGSCDDLLPHASWQACDLSPLLSLPTSPAVRTPLAPAACTHMSGRCSQPQEASGCRGASRSSSSSDGGDLNDDGSSSEGDGDISNLSHSLMEAGGYFNMPIQVPAACPSDACSFSPCNIAIIQGMAILMLDMLRFTHRCIWTCGIFRAMAVLVSWADMLL